MPGAEVRELAEMLAGVGRGEAVARLHAAARLAPLMALWEGYSPAAPFVGWLSPFFEQVVRAVE